MFSKVSCTIWSRSKVGTSRLFLFSHFLWAFQIVLQFEQFFKAWEGISATVAHKSRFEHLSLMTLLQVIPQLDVFSSVKLNLSSILTLPLSRFLFSLPSILFLLLALSSGPALRPSPFSGFLPPFFPPSLPQQITICLQPLGRAPQLFWLQLQIYLYQTMQRAGVSDLRLGLPSVYRTVRLPELHTP